MRDVMEEALQHAAHFVALLLEALALLVIAIGAIEAFVGICRHMRVKHTSSAVKRAVWLEFARWLVAGLTFRRLKRRPSWGSARCSHCFS